MRKLLAGFLLTLRWLLVPLIPVLGLLIGMWMKPEAKPKWEYRIAQYDRCSGIVEDNEATYLVIKCQHSSSMVQKTERIVTLDVKSGKVLSTQDVRYGFYGSKMELIPATTLALIWSDVSFNPTLIVYDWKRDIELDRFIDLNRLEHVKHPIYQNGTLAVTEEHEGLGWKRIVCWMPDKDEPTLIYEWQDRSIFFISHVDCFELSPDGRWGLLLHKKETASASGALENCLQILDTETGRSIQSMQHEIECVRWHPDSGSFLALQKEATAVARFWQRYVWNEGQFIPSGRRFPAGNGLFLRQTPSPFVVLANFNEIDPTRWRVSQLFGDFGKNLVERWWPAACVFHAYKTSSLELLGSISFPSITVLNMRHICTFPDPTGDGLILHDNNKLSYWEFHPSSRWYPWIGLGLGTLLAGLLAWVNLRRTTNRLRPSS